MGLYLVVAHQTAASDELISELTRLAEKEDPDAEFVLLVPSTPAQHLWTWVERDETANARANAGRAAARLREAGLRVRDTRVGAADPLKAIEDEVTRMDEPYDAIVISTLTPGISRWLRNDLPRQVKHRFGTRVLSVTSRAPIDRGMLQPPAPPAEESWKYASLESLARLRGSEVYCTDGLIGRMTEVLYDYTNLDPVWLGIASRPIPFRTLLIPAQLTRLEAGRLQVPLTRAKVHGQPHVDIGEGIPSLTDEARIYAYFGLAHEHMREIRVLHSGDPLPGSQWSHQRILE